MPPPAEVVGAPRLEVFKRVDHNQYLKLGRNGAIQTEPAVIQFEGFELGKSYKQTLRIVNLSDDPQRVRVLPTQTNAFKSHFEAKGTLAKGLAESVTIEFSPTEFEYYHDCIRINCEHGASMLVPIHAYPVGNTAFFPKLIDFGDQALGSVTTQHIPLSCKVPVEFEFNITVLESNPGIRVRPLKGVIPANDTVYISVEFNPVKMAVHRVRLKVSVAQFNLDPVICEVVGNCSPGLERTAMQSEIDRMWDITNANAHVNQVVADIRSEEYHQLLNNGDVGEGLASGGSRDLSKQILEQFHARIRDNAVKIMQPMLQHGGAKDGTEDALRSTKGPGSGAVLDPGAELLRMKHRIASGKQARQARRNKYKVANMRVFQSGNANGSRSKTDDMMNVNSLNDEESDYFMLDGFAIPKNVYGIQATNAVLTQVKGKLKLRDLQKAIEQQRLSRKQEQSQRAGAGLDTDITNRVKRSDSGVADASNKNMSTTIGNGDVDHDDDDDIIDRILSVERGAMDSSKSRQLKELGYLQALKESEEAGARKTLKEDKIGEDLLTMEQMTSVATLRDHLAEERARERRAKERVAWAAVLTGPDNCQNPQRAEYDESLLAALQDSHKPEFTGIDNDVWEMRRQALARLVRAVSCIIVRNRAEKRINVIKSFLGNDLKRVTREHVRQLVEQENRNPDAIVGARAVQREKERLVNAEMWSAYRAKLDRFAQKAKKKASRTMSKALSEFSKDGQVDEVDGQGGEHGDGEEKKTDGARGLPLEAVERYCARNDLSLETVASIKIGRAEAGQTVHAMTFPVFPEDNVTTSETLPMEIIHDFDDDEYFALRQPVEYLQCGYEPHPLPSFPDNIPQCNTQALRSGAAEEYGRMPSTRNAAMAAAMAKAIDTGANPIEREVGMVARADLSSCIQTNIGSAEILDLRRPCAVLERVDGLKTELDPEFMLAAHTAGPLEPHVPSLAVKWAKSIEQGSVGVILRQPLLSNQWHPVRDGPCASALQNWLDSAEGGRGVDDGSEAKEDTSKSSNSNNNSSVAASGGGGGGGGTSQGAK